MELNLPLIKVIIRLLTLLILFVIMFMISAFLYSARYWPDVYNYINANITIKRIATISELNLTILSVDDGYTTESYSTTDDDYLDGTTDLDDITDNFEDFFPDRKKRQLKIVESNKDYIELPKNVVIDYIFENDLTTEMSKQTTNEEFTTKNSKDVEIIGVVGPERFEETQKLMEPSCNGSNVATTTFPWLATIFIKNGSSNQFDYFCDGALLSHNTILTAARCVNGTDTFASESILVIVGKRSLQVPRNDESVHRVKQVLVHEKFADVNETGNDVAILVLEDPVVFSSSKRIACMQSAEIGVGDAFTTGWGYSGNLTAIRFDKKKSESCQGSGVANTFCATYANGVTVCPSFGGIYAAQQGDQWVLRGLRTGDPMNRGFCIDKTVVYTNLDDYNDWIVGNIEKN